MKNKDFWIRLRSSAVMLVLGGAALIFGGIPLFILLLLVSVLGLFELYRAGNIWPDSLAVAGIVGGCLYLEAVLLGWDAWLLFVIVLSLMLIMAVYVFTFPRHRFEQAAFALFGMLYVPVMISYIYRIRIMEGGAYLVWLVVLASCGSDIMAYCTGLLLGKHKLAPELSPKKSVEGAVGGVLGAAVFGVVYGLLLREKLVMFAHPVLGSALLCGIGSLISQIGDLAASAVKRNAGIKDYSKLIPGHGGIMDRLDSIIPTAPFVYYLILLLSVK